MSNEVDTIPPPRYVTMAELEELQAAWVQDPRWLAWAAAGYLHWELPIELQNIVVTRDGLPPPPDGVLVDIPAGEGPLRAVDLD